MRYIIGVTLIAVVLVGFIPGPQPQSSMQFLPLAPRNHEPGLMVQPVWYVSAQPAMSGELLIVGSMPASCSELRYEISAGPVARVILWSVRPGVECFDTLKPFFLYSGLTCSRYSVSGATVKCEQNPYP